MLKAQPEKSQPRVPRILGQFKVPTLQGRKIPILVVLGQSRVPILQGPEFPTLLVLGRLNLPMSEVAVEHPQHRSAEPFQLRGVYWQVLRLMPPC